MRSFLIKLSIITVALLVLQMIVSALYPPELPDEIVQLERHLHAGADLIYLGDSTVTYPAGEVTTAEILQEMLPDHRVGQVAHPVYNLDLYRSYAGYIARADSPPGIVIIPINLRSFSPEWDLRPAYQFEREKTILAYGPRLSAVFYRPLNALGAFEPSISQDDFLNAPVFDGETPVGQVADFEALLGNTAFDTPVNDVESAYYSNLPATDKQETLQTRLTYYYMYELTPAHRKMQSMVTTARLLKAAGIEPVFYITPINYQLGRQFVGEIFERRITENVTLIAEVLQAENVEVLNLVFELEAYHFIDTEHLTENGKAQVAEALAAVIDPARPVYAQTTLPPTPTPTAKRPRPARDESQTPTGPVAASPIPLPTAAVPTASPPAPTPTSTRVVPLTVTPSAGQGRIKNVEFIGTFQPSSNYLIDLYRVSYRTLNHHNRPVDVRANIYIPRTAGETALPVLVYGGGTTGIGPNCPPLEELRRQQMWGGYHYQMLEYAAQGLIVVWSNGQGFDDGQPAHPYFMAKLQGYTMLDAARAVYRFFDDPAAADLAAEPMAAVFFGGYSSGGHSAFAAKDWAAGYAPELSVKGIIGHGPTTNVETLLKENPIFSPYLVSAYRAFYGETSADPARIFQDRWLANFNADTMTKCVDDIFAYYSPNARQMYRTEFREALYSDRLQSGWPGFKQLLDANATGLSPAGAHIPVLILQGTADQVVTPPSQERFALDLCRLGNKVTYLTYPAATHAETRNLSFRDTLAWMHALAEGERPGSSCTDLIGQ